MNNCRKHLPLFTFFCMIILSSAPFSAIAVPYEYTYSGKPLTGTHYDGEYIPYLDGRQRALTITFQYDDDKFTAPISTIPQFTMSNGVTTLSSLDNTSFFTISSLDSNGLPLNWYFEIQQTLQEYTIGNTYEIFYAYRNNSELYEISSRFKLIEGTIFPIFPLRTDVAWNIEEVGTWSKKALVSSVPEPNTVLLLSFSLIGLAALSMKRSRKRYKNQ
ncbi:MAG: PEP-CTERM sorting domain-containing protein [Syntrophobacteraceae bacterium]